MTQEQKQFIIKALQTGAPALADEYISAMEEVARIAESKQDELDEQEQFQFLNQEIYDVTIKVIQASVPYMAYEYIKAYTDSVNVCNAKLAHNRTAREEKEKIAAEAKQKSAPDKKKQST